MKGEKGEAPCKRCRTTGIVGPVSVRMDFGLSWIDGFTASLLSLALLAVIVLFYNYMYSYEETLR